MFRDMVVINTDEKDDDRYKYDWNYIVPLACGSEAEERCEAAPTPSPIAKRPQPPAPAPVPVLEEDKEPETACAHSEEAVCPDGAGGDAGCRGLQEVISPVPPNLASPDPPNLASGPVPEQSDPMAVAAAEVEEQGKSGQSC